MYSLLIGFRKVQLKIQSFNAKHDVCCTLPCSLVAIDQSSVEWSQAQVSEDWQKLGIFDGMLLQVHGNLGAEDFAEEEPGSSYLALHFEGILGTTQPDISDFCASGSWQNGVHHPIPLQSLTSVNTPNLMAFSHSFHAKRNLLQNLSPPKKNKKHSSPARKTTTSSHVSQCFFWCFPTSSSLQIGYPIRHLIRPRLNDSLGFSHMVDLRRFRYEKVDV